jgi:transcriptional regulator with XRE-family HTH domain
MDSDDKYYQVIGERIALRRKALGIKQEELAHRVELTRTSLSNIEMGRQRTPVHTLYRIAEELSTTIRELLPVDIQEIEEHAARAAVHALASSIGLDPIENEQELREIVEKINQLKEKKS